MKRVAVILALAVSSSAWATNDFSGSVAWWGFENTWNDGTTAGTNDLTPTVTPGAPTFSSSTKKIGSYSAKFMKDNSEAAYRADSGLSSDFPGKSGTTNRTLSVGCWVYPNTVASADGAAYAIASKYRPASNKRSWALTNFNPTGAVGNSISLWWGLAETYNYEALVTPSPGFSTGQWWYIGAAVDGATRNWNIYVVDSSGNITTGSGTLPSDMLITDTAFVVAGRVNSGATGYEVCFDGYIDDLFVDDQYLTATDWAEVVAGTWDGTAGGTTYSGPDYYVGPSSTGSGSGEDRSNLMSIASFKGLAVPGDRALLQPGSYGAFAMDNGYGDSDYQVTYTADTGAPGYSPRTTWGPNWYTGLLDSRPTPSNYPCFSSITITDYGSGGTPTGHYITFENVATLCGAGQESYGILGRAHAKGCVFRNVAVLGPELPRSEVNRHLSYEFTAEGIRADKDGGDSGWEDMLFDSCYVESTVQAVRWNVTNLGGCEFRDCRFTWMMFGTFISGTGDQVKFTRCHVDTMPPHTIGDTGNPQPVVDLVYVDDNAIDTGTSTTEFTYSGTDPGVFINDTGGDHVAVTHSGTTAVRRISAINQTTNTVTLADALPWTPSNGDKLIFYECCHGCGFTLMRGNIWLDSCIVHDVGNTGTLYSYSTYGEDIDDITIENCLFFGPRWTNNPCIDLGQGDTDDKAEVHSDIIIRNNTLVGLTDGSQSGAYDYTNYGRALWVELSSTGTASTIQITNNLCVGMANAVGLTDGQVRNNITYSGSGFSTGSTGTNKLNQVLRVPGTVEIPFNTGWFAGDVSACWSGSQVYEWLYDEFDLANGAAGIDAGSATAGDYTSDDIDGATRSGTPDVGAWEGPSWAGRRRVIVSGGN